MRPRWHKEWQLLKTTKGNKHIEMIYNWFGVQIDLCFMLPLGGAEVDLIVYFVYVNE